MFVQRDARARSDARTSSLSLHDGFRSRWFRSCGPLEEARSTTIEQGREAPGRVLAAAAGGACGVWT